MRKINIVTLVATTLLTACSDITKPVYWTCSGTHIQLVKNQLGKTLEKYEGKQNLMLEIYDGSVSQFNAPATFGVYKLCLDTKEIIEFSHPKCRDVEEGMGGDGDSYIRFGSLNKLDGSLVFSESRKLTNLKIVSSGTYVCNYLGHRYTYDDLKPADDG